MALQSLDIKRRSATAGITPPTGCTQTHRSCQADRRNHLYWL